MKKEEEEKKEEEATTEKEEDKKEEEKEKAEEKKEEKEKVNMLTKLSNAFSKLKPQPSAAASAAPEAKAEDTPSDKPETEEKEVGESFMSKCRDCLAVLGNWSWIRISQVVDNP